MQISIRTNKPRQLPFLLSVALLVCLCAAGNAEAERAFTLAVIPDTQNYIDFRHQKSEGWELDGSAMFIEQMRYVAANSLESGGEIVFVAAVGDVWQHQSMDMDPEHRRRGFKIQPNPILARRANRAKQVHEVELPTAIEGYRLISESGLPFGVAPGNHDYDAAWSADGFPPDRSRPFAQLERTVEDFGILHVGGLDNFRRVFGDDSDFFRDRSWYVSSFRGGANSAQVFSAGGYDFLHIALEMQPADDVLRWAELVISSHHGMPTILTTHDYLDRNGRRRPHPLIDLTRVDPEFHNSAEQLWDKLISRQDQIFLVLSGHHHGQAFRTDKNQAGNPVYQILADYQDRGQALVDAGRSRPGGLGDGWLRLMRFDFESNPATISVRTYSSHYRRFSSDTPEYAAWYREQEQPMLSDEQFLEADDFVIHLDGFRQRFDTAD